MKRGEEKAMAIKKFNQHKKRAGISCKPHRYNSLEYMQDTVFERKPMVGDYQQSNLQVIILYENH